MEVEYIDECHTYLCDGVIIPSVSDLLKFKFPKKYDGIPEYILSTKADFGTAIHKAIEDYERGEEPTLTPLQKVTFGQYLKLKDAFIINPVEIELMIVDEQGRYAGRLDMIADVNYRRCLIDIKTTAKVDEYMLSWQLGLYKLGYKKPIEHCYVLWLPKKDLGKLIEILPKSKKECEELIEEYYKWRNR